MGTPRSNGVRASVRRATAYLTNKEGLGPLLIRAMAGSGIVRAATILASFAVGVLLARRLGVQGYGYYGVALAVLTIAGIPGELGVPRLVTREVAASEKRNDLAYLFGVLEWANVTVTRVSAVTMLAVAAAAVVLEFTRPSPLDLALLLGAPTIPLMAVARLRGGTLQGLHHIVRGQIPANLIRPLLLSLLLILGWGFGTTLSAGSAMGLTSLSAAGAAGLAHIWLKQRLPKFRPVEPLRGGRRWLGSSITMALSEAMLTLQGESSVLALGMLSGASASGLFRISNATAAAMANFGVMIAYVSAPVIARLYTSGDHVRLQKLVTAAARAMLAGVALLSLPLLIFSRPLLALVYGETYAPAANVLRILILAQIINAAFGPTGLLLIMTGHERRGTRALIIAFIVNLVALAILSPIWGSIGAAVSLLLATLTWNAILWLDARRLLAIETSALGHLLLRTQRAQEN